jgi:hypothetical protein
MGSNYHLQQNQALLTFVILQTPLHFFSATISVLALFSALFLSKQNNYS